MKVLFAAAEMFPFAKSGGLADIAYALPRAMGERADVTAIMPLYRFIDKERFGIRPAGEHFKLSFGDSMYDVEIFVGKWNMEEVVFVYNSILCDRDYMYGPPGKGYEDNDLRFAIFCHALIEMAKRHSFTLLHLNDWHTALAALLAHETGLRVKTVFTIHNLAYQGIFPLDSLETTGVAKRYFNMEELEFFNQVNWMKGGIAHADAVTTVSPSYAVEILEPEYGCGLDGFLRKHQTKLSGILNGIDTTVFDPSSDSKLPAVYDVQNMEGKSICKKSFLSHVDIDKYEWPLFIFIGRFVEQKGLDLIIETMEDMAGKPMLLAILGEGESRFQEKLEKYSKSFSNIYLRIGYDESLSRLMYAAADFLLMPSRFEPCGLNQMIAMRYGTIPIVHSVGGLRDTVHTLHSKRRICGLGLTFEEMTPSAFLKTLEDAIALYGKKQFLQETIRFDMSCNFSIRRCAERYLELYRSIL